MKWKIIQVFLDYLWIINIIIGIPLSIMVIVWFNHLLGLKLLSILVDNQSLGEEATIL